jgi:hypothetical protein
MMEETELHTSIYTPPLYSVIFLIIAIFFTCIACFPSKTFAEPLPKEATEVTLSQQIRAGACYDAANTSIVPTQDYLATVDYISVWSCDIQR